MSDGALVLGLDVGTTRTKGAVYDLAGRRQGHASRSYRVHRPRPGWAEQDPEDWWRAVRAVVAEIGGHVDLGRVAALGVCSQVNTHVFVDRTGAALCPAILWQDQRCVAVTEELNARLDTETTRRIWGHEFAADPSFLLARGLWLVRHEPELWRRTTWILSPKDFVNLRLTGRVGSDSVSSIGLVGRDGRYLEGLDELAPGVAERLPPLGDLADVLGTTVPEAGLPRPVPVAHGTMDAWGNLFGSGVMRPGLAMEVSGTSEILATTASGPGGAPGVVSFVPWRGLWVHAGPTQAGGGALRWVSETIGRSVEDALAASATTTAGSGGVVFLPQLLGERAPLWDPHLRAGWVGVSFDTGRAELCRAVLEGVAFAARHLLEALDAAAGKPPSAIVISGGGAASDLWCQIKADVLGRPLDRSRELDTGVLGAGMIGALAAGLAATPAAAVDGMVGYERRFEPAGEHHEAYHLAYTRYRRAQERLADLFA